MIQPLPEATEVQLRSWIAAGEVVTYLGSLKDLQNAVSPDLQILSEEERDRYARFQDAEDARAFYGGRMLLRSVLGFLIPGAEVEIRLSPKGKPSCPHPSAPHFSLSHGGGWILISFCSAAAVGVDVESLRRAVPVESLARRYFSENEQTELRKRGPEEFFKIWIRKEARAKAEGDGLSVPVRSIPSRDPGWIVHEFSPDPDSLAVVTYPGPARPHHLIRGW
ncbi:MAG: 4'-phosphopantetheinyl transferase family protein [Kiritimatiellia bacterium]